MVFQKVGWSANGHWRLADQSKGSLDIEGMYKDQNGWSANDQWPLADQPVAVSGSTVAEILKWFLNMIYIFF